ncbi:Oidioi.mRNA.OKI2018_I69.chr1.g3393.t1.cds [Oikopleura dioica]|uniref:Oidioi.mRNA.OKI2018_I69.chr1.g3393.t1.cds n=1 Tax=Oikopleura dioica TaxID=34765 RepID=A0ABN7SUK8_OIKDI|nr:Oidioi.mRNA.OKI2018_I69.chr1.g3393.t1.cds [Oikopleura dioica]
MNALYRFIAILCLFNSRAWSSTIKWYPSSVHGFIEQKIGSSAIITCCIHDRWTNFTLFYMPYNNSTGFKHRTRVTTFLDKEEGNYEFYDSLGNSTDRFKVERTSGCVFEPGFEQIDITINDIQLGDEGFYFHEVDNVKYYSTWIIVLEYEPGLLQGAVLLGVLVFFALLCTCGWCREKQYQKSRKKKQLYLKSLNRIS